MEVTLAKKEATLGTLTVQIKEADIKDRIDAKIKDYSKRASLKGFRPGKVPTGVVKQMFGESIIAEEVGKVLNEKIDAYIKDNQINIIGEPLPAESDAEKTIDWKNDKEFSFSFDLGIVPEFDVKLDGLSFNNYVIAASDADVAKAIDNIRKRFAEHVDVETSEANDILSGKIKVEGAEEEGKLTMIGLNRVNEASQKVFLGKKAGDVITFNPKDVFDSEEEIAYVVGIKKEEVADLSASYSFEVEKVKRESLAEINQTLFDMVFGKDQVTNEEEFKAKIVEIITDSFSKETDGYLFYEIQDALISNTTVEVSREFLVRWLAQANQVDIAQIEPNIENYEREVRWSFIKNKLVRDNDIKVQDAELRAKAAENLKAQIGLGEIPAELEDAFNKMITNHLKENNGKNYVDTFESLLSDKLFLLFKEKVNVTDKNITTEEFEKIVKEAK